ncbi:MAG: M3 family oligoendopeptidase [Clostridia bacterium]|nr:M3 family oligoendopeptidase [Clostridia bacterium]
MEKFKDLKYERPDLEALKKKILANLKLFKKAKTFEEADKYMLAWEDDMMDAMTQMTIAHIRNTINMADEFYDAEKKYFDANTPKLMPVMKETSKALLKSKFRPQLEEKYGSHMFKSNEIQEKLMKLSIIPQMIEENKLTSEYSKVAAACSVEFMGEKCNFYGLLKHMQSVDRNERKEAFLAWAKLYEDASPKLDEIFGKLVDVRVKLAKKLGYKLYTDYAYLSRERYDYDKDDVEKFRDAVCKYITPVCEKLYRDQAERLGLESLNWYDESLVFAEGNADPIGTPDELVEAAKKMYSAMSPETKEFFDFLTEYELYDFVTRENKHLGGYCTSLPKYKAPFIFSNFNGTSADVDVLTHEAGHAFEGFYASRRLPLANLVFSTSEINEIHSMTMEYFAYPYMEGFFGDKADKNRYAHFTESIKTIPYLVSVDEFQHRVYENPKATPEERRRYWKEIEQKYMPWRHYDGNAFLEGGGFWMQKQHIFLYPFYYVDYAMAQLCALQLYKTKSEGGDAWSKYLNLCSMGGMYGYFETLNKAGLRIPLSEDVVKEMAEFAEKEAEELKKKV